MIAKRVAAALTLIGLMLGTAPAVGETDDKHLDYEAVLSYLTDLDKLPAIHPGVYCKQFSSYDRLSKYDPETDTYIHWDANADAGKYLRIDPDTKEGVMAEMEGPGCVFRIWSANPQGVIRFYLDGDTEPTYEFDFNGLFLGETEPFIRPLVYKRDPKNPQSASDCYLPIPFNKSCRITSVIKGADGKNQTPGHYYIINYRVWPEDWTVDTFKLPLDRMEMDAVRQTAHRWAQSGKAASHPLDHFATEKIVLPAGESRVISAISGPAIIREFRLKLDSEERWASRKIMIKAYWDGSDEPAINCPIGDFFGDPLLSTYQSYPMGITREGAYCFFPMPFRKSARIVLVNDGRKPARIEGMTVYRKEQVPDDWALFHAKWRTEPASTSFDYPLIKAEGTGKLVGITVFPHNHHGGWWGEGDEKVYVDGEKFPSWFGTGSEDYFGDAWGIREMHNPSHGFPQHREGSSAKELFACYRWHLADSIPYYKSFFMTIENYTGLPNVETRNDYSSVAYWYQKPGGNDFFEDPAVWDRIPREYTAPGAVEAETPMTKADLSEGMELVDSQGLPRPLSGHRAVKLTGTIGDTFTLKLPVPKDEYYFLDVHLARGVPASEYAVLVDGRPINGPVHLKKGVNRIGIRFVGKPVADEKCELIVDCFTLRVHRRFIQDWLVMLPFPYTPGNALDKPFSPEEEFDRDATYEGRGGEEISWQKISAESGMILLNELIDPHEDCVAYGICTVIAPEAGRYTMLLGSDDGVKVWINGEQVFRKSVRRGVYVDSDEVEVDLDEGVNTLLIKIDQGPGDLGWVVRFRDPKSELEYGLPR